jgi:N-acetylmuramoyl-L-alanine amidase
MRPDVSRSTRDQPAQSLLLVLILGVRLGKDMGLGDTGAVKALVSGLLAAALGSGSALPPAEAGHAPAAQVAPVVRSSVVALPLAGSVVVIDAGHQLGNHNFPALISRLVPAGGFTKPCNTTGTATNGGYPEATFTMAVSRLVKRRLTELGAQVIMTRTRDSQELWGPCVDVRGRAGNAADADLKLSIHADGATTGRGFHVIAPTDRARWTHDIHRPSRRLALGVRAALRERGLPYADYTAGGDGLDFRGDLATLNLSDVPAVMVELGNMRARADARLMTSTEGRQRYAAALVTAIRRQLG